ncbi:MAG: hypothetical protein WC701_04485 [Kiritimatiellales bacterium]|jgi:hypothetical protein
MRAIREIGYQYFSLEGLQALYMAHLAFLDEKAGVYLTNSCLRELLPTHSRVHPERIEEVIKTARHIFPYQKIVRWDNVYGLILGSTVKAISNHKSINSLPNEAEMLKQLGFRAQKMVIGLD